MGVGWRNVPSMGGAGDMMTAAAITSRKSDIIAGTRDIQEPARKGREPRTLPGEQTWRAEPGAGDPVT